MFRSNNVPIWIVHAHAWDKVHGIKSWHLPDLILPAPCEAQGDTTYALLGVQNVIFVSSSIVIGAECPKFPLVVPDCRFRDSRDVPI